MPNWPTGILEPLGGIALFGLAFPMLGNHTVHYFYLSFLVGSIVAGIAVVPLVLARTRRLSSTLLQNAVLPLVGFAAVAFSVASPQSTLARGAFMVFFSFAIILLLGELVERARSKSHETTLVFSAAVGIYALASLAGSALSLTMEPGPCSTTFTVLVLLYLACIAVRPTLMGRQEGASVTRAGGGTNAGAAPSIGCNRAGPAGTLRTCRALPPDRAGSRGSAYANRRCHFGRDRGGAGHLEQHGPRPRPQRSTRSWESPPKRSCWIFWQPSAIWAPV